MKHTGSFSACVLLLILQSAAAAPEPAATNAVFAACGMLTVDSAETAAALQRLVGPETRLVYDKGSGSLLVFGPPAAHALLRDALRGANRPPLNVRLDVAIGEARRATAAGVREAAAAQTRQQLVVRSGGEAALQIGETVPFANDLIAWGHRRGLIAREVTLRRVGASLAVRALVIGDGPLVQVTLTPELSGVYTRQGDRIRFTEAATALTVRYGEEVTLASFAEHADFYRLFLAGAAPAGEQTRQQITLRVTLDAPAAPP